MPTVHAIHTEEDRPFVEKQLIRALPSLGFDRWISSAMLPPDKRGLIRVKSTSMRF